MTMLRRPPSITNFESKLANEEFQKAFRHQLSMDFEGFAGGGGARQMSALYDMKQINSMFGKFNSSVRLANF